MIPCSTPFAESLNSTTIEFQKVPSLVWYNANTRQVASDIFNGVSSCICTAGNVQITLTRKIESKIGLMRGYKLGMTFPIFALAPVTIACPIHLQYPAVSNPTASSIYHLLERSYLDQTF